MRYHATIILGLCLIPLTISGQRVRMLSASDGEPIAHVAVYSERGNRASISDTLGWIDLSAFDASDTIIFQHPSYLTARLPFEDLKQQETIRLYRKKVLIEEYVISASKYRENKLKIPYMVDVLEQELLMESTGLSSAEILESTGNILVQKTQGGGGSPILRGFEANKILLVVDGVRMNNAIYRSGHLQNSITIDNAILDRTEVIFGPSSIIYGSDALGGVIHYYTRDPELSGAQETLFHMRASTQFSTAMNGLNGHLDVNVGREKWGSLTSVTYKDLGDIRTGSRRDPYMGNWGKVMHYAGRYGGRDTTLINENPLVQLNTGYQQLDLLQKIRYTPSGYMDWVLNVQYSTSSDISRLDKLNDYAGDNLKYVSYYYGPQDRFLASLKNEIRKDNRFFTNMTTILAFQDIDEDRHSRRFGVDERLNQMEEVKVFSFNTDLLKIWESNHRLNYGLEFIHNRVTSGAFYDHIVTGEQTPAQTRYPDGGSSTFSASAYGSYKWILGEKLVLNGGTRYSWSDLQSVFTGNLLPYDRIRISNGALTGSLGLIFTPTDLWQAHAMASTGFRNPNVDDYGKIRAKEGMITIPNRNLKPEYSYNAELGISRIFEGYLKFEAVGFYTNLTEAIVRTDFQLNGGDSLLYDGEMYRITANHNAGRAYIYGASMGVTSSLNKNIHLKSTLNFTKGHNISDDVPLGHIPPLFGRTSLTYRKNRFFVDTYLVYQGWKDAEDFSPYGEDNESEAMAYGFPSWWTANVKTGIPAGDHLEFIFAIENILDQFYKPFASGVSAPGRNFVFRALFHL